MTPDRNGEDTRRPLILVVDDVPKNIQLLGSLLGGEGYHIAAAVSGEKALEMSRDLLPDLILMDIMMSDMDGIAVCRELKRSPDTAEIPVIFITAKTEKDDIILGLGEGAVDYITKPFNAIELLARVRTHLRLKVSLDVQKRLVADLKEALAKVKLLSGLLPICSHCKKVRDDSGYWKQVEEYVASHSEVTFSHGICPDCLRKYYPKYADGTDGDREE
ncbi:MAG: response regulator [Spirochaetes bacterium]|nr:response regulator [Spirochaetota bacterium]